MAGGLGLLKLPNTINPLNVDVSSSGSWVISFLSLNRKVKILDISRSRMIDRTRVIEICQSNLLYPDIVSSHPQRSPRIRFENPFETILKIRLNTNVKTIGYLSGLASDSMMRLDIFFKREE